MLPRLGSVADLLDRLRPGTRVFVPGVSGESLPFYDELRRNPDRARGLTFVGVHFPGINNSDYLALHSTVRQRAYFMSPSIRQGMANGRADLLPLDYAGIVRDLEDNVAIDLALAQVSPPDASGLCSLGVCQDFVPSVWAKARRRVAHINPSLPRTHGTFRIDLNDCEFAFEQASPIPTLFTDSPDEASMRHAAAVAGLIADGDTLQFGVGRLQAAVLGALAHHRRLRVYSGMVSTPVAALMDCGAIAGERAIETGVALGDADFYSRLSEDRTVFFRPARETHDVRRIANIANFCAVNSALQVDLVGQVNVDSLNGRLVAGVGGLPAFAAGAQLSSGGRSIMMLAATGDNGRTSRIVGSLGQSLVALPRHLADFVVSEYGVADLRGRSVHQRARSLIDIAAPAFRESLEHQWAEMAQKL
jgi:acyl-CoA hydrolase